MQQPYRTNSALSTAEVQGTSINHGSTAQRFACLLSENQERLRCCKMTFTDEPDKFDDDFNESESEEEDDGKEETVLRKNERAAKVCAQNSQNCWRHAAPRN